MIKVNPEFNPFEADTSFNPFDAEKSFNPFEQGSSSIENNQFYQDFKPKSTAITNRSPKKEVPKDWDKLYKDREPDLIPDYSIEDQTEIKRPPMPDYFKSQEAPQNQIQQKIFQRDHSVRSQGFFQLKNKYILTPVRSGLMIIDQRKAHERILFEKFKNSVENNQGVAQQTLFPQTIEFNASDYTLLQVIIEDVRALGFDIREFGKKNFRNKWNASRYSEW